MVKEGDTVVEVHAEGRKVKEDEKPPKVSPTQLACGHCYALRQVGSHVVSESVSATTIRGQRKIVHTACTCTIVVVGATTRADVYLSICRLLGFHASFRRYDKASVI